METAEKYGAFWEQSSEDGRIVFEKYDERRGLLALVFQRPDGLLKSVVCKRVKDPHWRLPIWSERRPEALFDRQEDAERHLTTLLEHEA
jgi:hypothetical protein